MITKTLGPIHFEDLDPHRFEDLVRDLLYDFRDWQSIEPTGRSGSDDGFDIRAWEKPILHEDNEAKEEEDAESPHPMEGNLWMIQCKREKEIGPKKIEEIINDALKNIEKPPYGYILAAPVNFSKKSYDTFRSELREKGVMEFYLLGKADLEDMLFLPKNDRVLFAFFGISLVTRRRSKSTQIRASFNSKNKLLRILSGGEHNQNLFKAILLRDINADQYPFKKKYKDFDKLPLWKEYRASFYSPLGLWVQISEHYAYIDPSKREFDYVESMDLLHRESDVRRYAPEPVDPEKLRIEDYWSHLPRQNQAKMNIYGLVLFNDILAIDDKGDVLFQFPHVYVDYEIRKGPFYSWLEELKIGQRVIDPRKEKYKKIKLFPKELPDPPIGTIYEDKHIKWSNALIKRLKDYTVSMDHIYGTKGQYDYLEPRDTVLIRGSGTTEDSREKIYLEIMYKYNMKVSDYLKNIEIVSTKNLIEEQVGRPVKDEEVITIFEVERRSEWNLKGNRSNG